VRFLVFLALIVSSISVAYAAPDQIDQAIAAAVPKEADAWQNGLFQGIDLPPSASASEIAARVARSEGAWSEQFKDYRIVASKMVKMPDASPQPYMAILISSGRGSESLILAQYVDLLKGPQATELKVGFSQGQVLPSALPKLYWWHRTFFITTVP
jgi:hypothetical protein